MRTEYYRRMRKKMCEHKRLRVSVRDFGIYDEKENKFLLEDDEYRQDGDWSDWHTKDGLRQEQIGDIECADCGKMFVEGGYLVVELGDVGEELYEKLDKLMNIISSELTNND
jgi:hypothetical protein